MHVTKSELKQYFSWPDTPEENSPVGKLMLGILEKNPGMEIEQSRIEANRLLTRAAGKRRYSVPRPMSQEELAALRERFQRPKQPVAA